MDRNLACATVTAASGESLAGTAPLVSHLVIVTLPLPWPAKILNHPLLVGLDSPDITVIGVVGDRSDNHQIVSYKRNDPDPLGPMLRYEVSCPQSQLVDTIEQLSSTSHRPPLVSDPVDVLICTHGSRDRCCGHSGTLLHVEMLAAAPDGVRIWRASHVGGHRFAPTVITLPDGLSWGFLNGDILSRIIKRSAGSVEAAVHLRGHLGAPDRDVQVADVAAFSATNWHWLDQSRSAEVLSRQGYTLVGLKSPSRDKPLQFEVRRLPEIPVPVCGEAIESSVKGFVPRTAQMHLFG